MSHFIYSTPFMEHFDPWDVKHLLSSLLSLAMASSLGKFKPAWKTATHFSDLTLLCIDNQQLSIMLQF